MLEAGIGVVGYFEDVGQKGPAESFPDSQRDLIAKAQVARAIGRTFGPAKRGPPKCRFLDHTLSQSNAISIFKWISLKD
jgi:hypothetical protein